MSKVTIQEPPIRPDTDKAKKVFKAAIEIIKRLDDIVKQKKAYRDVFLPEAVNLRYRLQDNCERLMFYDPLEYGRKAEELLWRKVFYDVIQLMKHNRKQMRPSSAVESAFRNHLSSALGYYTHLMLKLQSEFHLHLEGIADLFFVPHHADRGGLVKKAEPSAGVKAWAIRACHRSLIYLGDIARYHQDYDGGRSRTLAQRYYHLAIALNPEIGMPFNQLGTLAGSRYYNLDATYYYLRCIVSKHSFEGALGNLKRLFEKNRKRYNELHKNNDRDLPPDQQRSKDIRRFLVRFLYLLDVLGMARKEAPTNSVDQRSLQELCQATLQDFNLCMFYPPPSPTAADLMPPGDERIYHMDEDVVFKVVVLCIIAIHRNDFKGSRQLTAAIAFSLALFSHLLNHVVVRLQAALDELENPGPVLTATGTGASSTADEDVSEDSTDEDTAEDVSIKSKLKSPHSARNRNNSRRRRSSAEPCLDHTKSPKVSPKSPKSPKRTDSDKDKDKEKVGRRRDKRKEMVRRRRRRRGSDCSTSSSSPDSSQSEDSDISDLSEGEKAVISEGSDVEANFLNRSDSDSDSDDHLMVSQELKPGFSVEGGSCGDLPLIEEELTMELPALMKTSTSQKDPVSLSASFSSALLNDLRNFNNSLKESDLSSYFKDIPSNWLGDTPAGTIVDSGQAVRIPPGFEKSAESQAVQEITEKLNNFVIETDTDSNFPTDTENSTVTESEQEVETDTDKDSVIERVEDEQQARAGRRLQVAGAEGLLMAVKVYADWMRCNPAILATCAKTSSVLWSRLSVLLNFLPNEDFLTTQECCGSASVRRLVSNSLAVDWAVTECLPEDVQLREFRPLENTHLMLNKNLQKRPPLTTQQEAVLRACLLRKFGFFIAKLKAIKFSYDYEQKMFTGPIAQAEEQRDGTRPDQSKLLEQETRRNQLMRDMAQLRLQAEVKALEKEGGRTTTTPAQRFPPYLVPDASALMEAYTVIRQLAHSARFIVIIPLAVIDQLDHQKKDTSGARDAIRWLEAEFKKGNRYIRAQKSHEKSAVLPLKNLKKKDRDAWRFTQVVDCCKYFNQQKCEPPPPVPAAGDTTSSLSCILTSNDVHTQELSLRVKQAIVAGETDGISIQNTHKFFEKWKEVWNNKT